MDDSEDYILKKNKVLRYIYQGGGAAIVAGGQGGGEQGSGRGPVGRRARGCGLPPVLGRPVRAAEVPGARHSHWKLLSSFHLLFQYPASGATKSV